ncbi:MAG: hypothetical protein M1816_006408 [Peltula sp. TS41687]|nr:MAG: hypothetical protein M1816_006408 [Peltula sp. TS41687]
MSRLGRITSYYAGYNCPHIKSQHISHISQPIFTRRFLTTTPSSCLIARLDSGVVAYKKRRRHLLLQQQHQQQQVVTVHIQRVLGDLPIKPYYVGAVGSRVVGTGTGSYQPNELLSDPRLSEFRHALEKNDIRSTINAYSSLDPSNLLPKDVRKLAALISFSQRQFHGKNEHKSRLKTEENRALRRFVSMVVNHLKAGKLPPDPMASLHLLAFFRDSRTYERGKEFWAWLKEQGISYADARTYGAAIELLTWAGTPNPELVMPLSELEALYREALVLDPGQFNEYHFSHNAMVANKAQYAPLEGVRLLLLQGIMMARIMRGDWQNAYLALDTAIRLALDRVPRRFFDSVIYQRSVSEGWKTFMLACQTGVSLAPKTLTVLLTRLNHAQSIQAHPSKNMAIARAGLAAVEAHTGSRGELSSHHLTALASLLLKSLYVLPQRPPPGPEDETKMDTLEGCIRMCIEVFQGRGVQPTESLFRMVAIRAAKLNRPSLVGWAASGLSSLRPDLSSLRVILEAGGELGLTKMIEETWEAMVMAEPSIKRIKPSLTQRRPANLWTWRTLAKACYKSGHEHYLESQLSKYESTLNPVIVTRIRELMGRLEKDREQWKSAATQPSPHMEADVQASLTGLFQQLGKFQKYMRTTSRTYDFYRFPIDMNLLWTSVSLPGQVRSLYERVTTDPLAQPPEPEDRVFKPAIVKPAITPNGYPVLDLRFQNWKVVTELLIEAEINEQAREAAESGELTVDVSTERLITPSTEGEDRPFFSPNDAEDFEDSGEPRAMGASQDHRRSPALWADEDIVDITLRLRGMEMPKSHESRKPVEASENE